MSAKLCTGEPSAVASKVIVNCCMVKVAVIVPLPWIVAVVDADDVLPKLIVPEVVVTDQDVKSYPVLGLACMFREPSLYHVGPSVGLVVPPPTGLTANVTCH